LENIEKEIKNRQKEINAIKREISKLDDVVSKRNKNQTVVNLIDKSQVVLEKFRSGLIKKKVSILEKEMLDSLSKLERKENFITDININPDTFEITLYDRDKKVIPLDKLSAGERQIFAISFLWGLIKTTRKSLPVIIDTPLGRLDSSHRINLAKNYFPNVSHQVILLSTDAEIDKHLYDLMKDNISHSYSLFYNDECMCTKVKEGYFINDHKIPVEVVLNEV
ncbi:MAG: DNA sulfur modification protein DndD, partial [Hydrogenothermaceae bacterium]